MRDGSEAHARGGGWGGSGISSAQLKAISDGALLDAAALSTEDLPPIAGASRDDIPKVHRGLDANYSAWGARGTVLIEAGSSLCTAQAINSHFLLTARHCTQGMLPGREGDLVVSFADQGGNLVTLYDGPALVAENPGRVSWTNDLALILIQGMPICGQEASACARAQPNVPMHALLQWFEPDAPLVVPSYFAFFGYGTEDGQQNARVLRAGLVEASLPEFFGDNADLGFFHQWGEDAPRPCLGDSGGPLVNTEVSDGLQRPVHVGVLAKMTGGCANDSGAYHHAGLTGTDILWMLLTMEEANDLLGLGIECAAGAYAGASLFACKG